MNTDAKERIKEFALSLGVEDVGIGSVRDYKSPRSPSIESIFAGARSMVVLAFSELSNYLSTNKRIAMAGRIDSLAFARACVYRITRFIEKEFGALSMSTPFSYPLNMSPESKFGLIADFSQRHAAVAAGLGTIGRHNLVIHPRLGTRVVFSTVLTELELEPDSPVTEDLCTHCNLCVEACPAHALDEEGKTHEFKCLSCSQPNGLASSIAFWLRFVDSPPEVQKRMIASPEYMSLYQAQSLVLEYHCFACYLACPVGVKKGASA
ncbi:MAG TPA: 4Fe-4S binding protein [Deltaproteobacteria bacterium]|nr:4Fe-4S binding protein [Deltaproteobacteria bacterium]HOM30052.1 4Fe-4S binding protein [Deltaproteobacteria bacterium]HPP80090.1 4Fe-4S binding protein [Deltaproteobacteria bacterium]